MWVAAGFVSRFLLGWLADSSQVHHFTLTSLQPVYVQLWMIVIGQIFFAWNSWLIWSFHHHVAKPTVSDGATHVNLLTEPQKAWILFFCSDVLTMVGFVVLLGFFFYSLMSQGIDLGEVIAGKSWTKNVLFIEGSLAFFSGEVTFQVFFSNGVFYLVSWPHRDARS